VRRRVAVLGAGSWGTALAVHLGRIGHDVSLWARDASLAADIGSHRVNGVYLAGIPLPANVAVTYALDAALDGTDLVVSAIPTHGCRAVMRAAASRIRSRATIVSATKGLESDTLLRMSEVIAQELRAERAVVVLSGPSFAIEVAHQMPTAVLAASTNDAASELVQVEFRAPYFRLYRSTDVIGVEIGGATKNVIAIAAGVVEGLGLGRNALAALITRGLAEISRLACAAGGQRETTAGLSGLGDLVLTCTGTLSRNRHVGMELARGRKLADILAGMKMIAEGVKTTRAAIALGERHGVELPIASQMAAVLEGRSDVRTAVEALMVRRQRAEREPA
jgi:glycerol-3-phosphate dehydrogenase (NAD(P)+)